MLGSDWIGGNVDCDVSRSNTALGKMRVVDFALS